MIVEMLKGRLLNQLVIRETKKPKIEENKNGENKQLFRRRLSYRRKTYI